MEEKRRGEKKCAAAVEAVEKCAVPPQRMRKKNSCSTELQRKVSVWGCVEAEHFGTSCRMVSIPLEPSDGGGDDGGGQFSLCRRLVGPSFFLLPTSCHIYIFFDRQDVVKCLLVCAVGIVCGSRLLHREGRTGTVGRWEPEHPGRGAAEEWKS